MYDFLLKMIFVVVVLSAIASSFVAGYLIGQANITVSVLLDDKEIPSVSSIK